MVVKKIFQTLGKGLKGYYNIYKNLFLGIADVAPGVIGQYRDYREDKELRERCTRKAKEEFNNGPTEHGVLYTNEQLDERAQEMYSTAKAEKIRAKAERHYQEKVEDILLSMSPSELTQTILAQDERRAQARAERRREAREEINLCISIAQLKATQDLQKAQANFYNAKASAYGSTGGTP